MKSYRLKAYPHLCMDRTDDKFKAMHIAAEGVELMLELLDLHNIAYKQTDEYHIDIHEPNKALAITDKILRWLPYVQKVQCWVQFPTQRTKPTPDLGNIGRNFQEDMINDMFSDESMNPYDHI